MGLFGDIAAGVSEKVGNAAVTLGESQIQSEIARIRAERLAEHKAKLDETAAVNTEQRKIANDRQVRREVFDETVERAPQMREIKVADAQAVAQAEINLKTDPKNVELIAKAEAAKAKFAAVAAKDLQAELLKDPGYLKNMKAVLQVEHPERFAAAAASAANAAKSQFELQTAKELKTARAGLQSAMGSGDETAIRTARDQVAALEGTIGTAQQVADKTVIDTTRAIHDSVQKEIANHEALITKLKADVLADPNGPEAKAKKTNLERIERDLAFAEKTRDAARAKLQQLNAAFERNYGARTPEKPEKPEAPKPGLIETPKPAAATAKPATKFRYVDGKLVQE